MKLSLFLLSAIVSIGFVYSQNKVSAFEKDQKIETLKAQVVQLEKNIIEQKTLIESVDRLNDKRFGDLYIWLTIFVAVFAGAFVVNWFNTRNVAEKEAREEFDKVFEKYERQFTNLKIEQEKQIIELNSFMASLNNASKDE